MDNGAREGPHRGWKAKRNALEVPGDVVKVLIPEFFSDPMRSAMKAFGITYSS